VELVPQIVDLELLGVLIVLVSHLHPLRACLEHGILNVVPNSFITCLGQAIWPLNPGAAGDVTANPIFSP